MRRPIRSAGASPAVTEASRCRKRNVSFEKLLQAVAFGNREPDVLSSLASRLARLDNQLSKEDRKAVEALNGSRPISTITSALVNALDPDVQVEAARAALVGPQGARPGEAVPEPTPEQIEKAAAALLAEAAKPIAANPDLRNKLIQIKKSYEQTIDSVSKDELQEAGFSENYVRSGMR